MPIPSFGYPQECTKCQSLSDVSLRVLPHFRQGGNLRVMLIGQDPTIFRKPGRVSEVLMLDQENSQLSRWLRDMFGAANYQAITLYATNIVKCSFSKPPSTQGGLRFLQPYFANCKDYLGAEVLGFKPGFVLTFGEPAHALFISMLDNQNIPSEMQDAFKGQFHKARYQGFEFDYSPCLHIKNFRVAETYGESVREFRNRLLGYLEASGEPTQGND